MSQQRVHQLLNTAAGRARVGGPLCLAGLLCLGAGCPSSDSGGDTGQMPTGGIDTLSGTESDATETDDTNEVTTGISGTDAEGDTSTGDGLNCGEVDFVLEAVPPNVVLVLDKSGSMTTTWDADADANTPEETRWQSLHNVVTFVLNTFEAEINFGATLFPSTAAIQQLGQGACVVSNNPEVAVAMTNAAAVLDGIPPADAGTDGASVALNGATPATAGIQTALDHLKNQDDSVDRFIILVTDGAANCGSDADTADCPGLGCGLMEDYDANLPLVVGDAFGTDEIPTFVIGIDIVDALVGEEPDDGQVGANTFQELNAVAEAGGRAREGDEKFFNAENEIELQEALAEIAGQVVSCTIPLDPEPMAPNFVEIEIGGTVIPRVDDCASEDGWVYVNPEGPFDAIELCNAACESLADSGELDATYGCPPPG